MFILLLVLGVVILTHCVISSLLEIIFYFHKHYIAIWNMIFTPVYLIVSIQMILCN